jgi:activator of 2-hydroxyglutaryl-CoA dehydratase
MVTVGLDVGSTTVKAVVLDKEKNVLWKLYEPHHTKQFEKVISFCRSIKKDLGVEKFKLFVTGSGGKSIADILGAKFIQEVNAL